MVEAVLISSSPDQSIYSYKQNRSPRKNIKPLISRPSENFAPSNPILNIHEGGGRFLAHPLYLSSSFSPSVSVFNQQQRQPPLLPLPISKPNYFSLPAQISRGSLLSSPTNKKINSRTRDQDITPKKPKSSTSPKKQGNSKDGSRSITKPTRTNSETLLISSTNRLGPDPSDLPKEVSRVFKPVASSTAVTASANAIEDVEEFSGSIFSLAPPPSSLPLPKFSLKTKLSCNVGGFDAGATDNLRRLLRLR